MLCECELLLDGTAMAGELCRERVAARCALDDAGLVARLRGALVMRDAVDAAQLTQREAVGAEWPPPSLEWLENSWRTRAGVAKRLPVSSSEQQSEVGTIASGDERPPLPPCDRRACERRSSRRESRAERARSTDDLRFVPSDAAPERDAPSESRLISLNARSLSLRDLRPLPKASAPDGRADEVVHDSE